MLRALLLCAALVAPGLTQAQSFGSSDFIREILVRVQVKALGPTTFEVFDGLDTGPGVVWCAASIFARERLGHNSGSLWLAKGRSPSDSIPGRRSMIFSTVPVPGEYTSLGLNTRRAGKVLSVASANAQCFTDEFKVRVREVR